ncbi:hypothetical protein AB0A74_38620 [Saccharothrix sp. NPDC042600]|uniref:hypothetical protein n=1 Tax=Saccharothrix TaxID=2071 RepID=UPI0033F73DA8|nr:hypothetical protein GCM10017745_56740 [Saccharothrix mutabilis subsp. capreolus]
MSDPEVAASLPRGLRARMRPVWHGDTVADSAEHENLPVLVADWGSYAQPQSRRAKPVAEPYLRGHLARAEAAGRRHGLRVGLLRAVPVTAVLVLVALLLPEIG